MRLAFTNFSIKSPTGRKSGRFFLALFECNTRKDRARLKGDGRENQPDFKGDGVRAEYQRAHAGEQQLRSHWCGAWFHEERKCIVL